MTAAGLSLAAVLAVACAELARRLAAAREAAARASHELRGPLCAAQLALDALVARGELGADRGAALESQLRRARLALDDLLAAPGGGRAPDRPEEVPAAALVAQVALAWRPVAAAHGTELRVSSAGLAACVLLVDRTRMAQALGNLLSNALEHGSGPVELRCRPAGGSLRLEVRDGGPGLPAPVADLVRRPRAGRGRRGRGLAIVDDIARRHGGRLTAAPSPAGAALALELPLHPARAAAALLEPRA